MDGQKILELELTPIAGKYLVRWGRYEDVPALVEIDKHSIECLWNRRQFSKMMDDESVIMLVVTTLSKKPVAFLAYEIRDGAINILNFVVHPNHRRQKIGTSLISNVKRQLREGGPQAIYYDVRESNLPAQLFLRQVEMKAYKVDHSYFKHHFYNGEIPDSEAAFCFRYPPKPTAPRGNHEQSESVLHV